MTKPAALSLLDQAPPPPDPSGLADGVLQAPAGWPAAPDPAAHHGLAGEIVSKLAPHTEADPVAILSQLLVAFGAAVGRGAWFQVEATRHHPNEYLVLVGDSARARKGSSWDHVAGCSATPTLRLQRIPHRPLYRRGADLGGPRPGRHRRRPRRPATAGDRTGVRDRAQSNPSVTSTRSRRCCAPPGTAARSRS